MWRLLAAAALVLAVAGGAVAAVNPLAGVYRSTVAGARPAQLNGVWSIAIDVRGAYAIAKQGVGTLVRGRATVSGSRVTFGGETGPAACTGAQARGVYRWILRSRRLTLKPVRDGCPGRRAVLTSGLTRTR